MTIALPASAGDRDPKALWVWAGAPPKLLPTFVAGLGCRGFLQALCRGRAAQGLFRHNVFAPLKYGDHKEITYQGSLQDLVNCNGHIAILIAVLSMNRKSRLVKALAIGLRIWGLGFEGLWV